MLHCIKTIRNLAVQNNTNDYLHIVKLKTEEL